MIGVYIIRNRLTGRRYVGSSIDVERRFRDHRSGLRGGKHVNRNLQEDWYLFGEDCFDFKILLAASDAHEAARFEEQILKDWGELYNVSRIAIVKRMGAEAKKKLRDANLGKKRSAEAKRKTSESLRKAHAKNSWAKEFPKEAREGHKKWFSDPDNKEAFRKKMSAVMKESHRNRKEQK